MENAWRIALSLVDSAILGGEYRISLATNNNKLLIPQTLLPQTMINQAKHYIRPDIRPGP